LTFVASPALWRLAPPLVRSHEPRLGFDMIEGVCKNKASAID